MPNGTDVLPFDFNNHPVRVVMIDGEPWFVAADLCGALGIIDVRRAVDRLDQADRRQAPVRSSGQDRSMWLVNESGLNELVIRSDKPEARPFRRWITSEVLPQIRKTGAYVTPSLVRELSRRELAQMVIDSEDARELAEKERNVARRALTVASNTLAVAETIIETRADDVLFAQDYLSTEGLKAVADFGRDLPGVGPRRIFRLLREAGIYQQVADLPYAEHFDARRFRRDPATGEVMVTPAGEKWLRGKLLGPVNGQERL